MRHQALAVAGSLVVGFTLWACSGDDPPGPSIITECTGPVTATVSSGSSPVFSWTPTCSLFFLLVEPQGSGADLWSIISDSTNAIPPPVTYGVVPGGATELDAPQTLVPGTAYDVYLFRWTGPGSQDGVMIGTASFTR